MRNQHLCLLFALGAVATTAGTQCSPPPPCDTLDCATTRRAQGLPYRIPAAAPDGASALVATDERLADEAAVTFIHVFKAGGSTVKNVITLSALLGGWWTSIAPSDIGWPSFVVQPEEERSIPRYISGAHGLGHCELTARPCVYFTVLRDPLDRLVSEYDYFCVKGREGRKEWNADWKRSGACGASLVEWAERSYQRPKPNIGEWNWADDGSNSTLSSHPNFLLDRFSGSGAGDTATCALEDAQHNLGHPCMRYLLLPKGGEGMASLELQLERLAGQLGPVFNATLRHALGFQGHMTWKNVNGGKSPTTREQMQDEEVKQRVRELIAPDLELWDWALEHYEEQWSRPLSFCHERPTYTGPGSARDLDYWAEWLVMFWQGAPFHLNQPYVDSLSKAAPYAAGWLVFCLALWVWKRNKVAKVAAEAEAEAATRDPVTAAARSEVEELTAQLREQVVQSVPGMAKKVEGKSDAEVDAMIEEMGAAVEKRRREKQSENPRSSTKQPARPALPPRPKDE